MINLINYSMTTIIITITDAAKIAINKVSIDSIRISDQH